MENNNNGAQGAQSSTVKPIWEVLGGQTDQVVIQQPTQEEVQNKDNVETTVVEPVKIEEVKQPEVKVEPVKSEEVKTELNAADVKTDEVKEVSELTLGDIKDAPTLYKEGSLQKYADELGFTIPDESFDTFKKTFQENFVPKAEVEKIAEANKEKYFSTLPPQIAAAFDLIALGVPEELALNPTKVQDEYLAMDDVQLVRSAIATKKGYDEAMVDAEVEALAAEPTNLEMQAKIIRANLNNAKEEILNEQSQLVQKYTEQKQQAIQRQKEQEETQFKEALANEQAFLGLTLSKEYKDGLWNNYKKGKYNEILSPAQAKVRAIILMESGDKFAKTALSKAKEDGKAEIVRKLSDVPIKAGTGGGQHQPLVPNNQEENKGAFSNMPFLHQ